MDAFSDPEIEEIIVWTSSQVGKTTIIENVVGYYIDQDPAPILVVQPILDVARTFSKDRLSPMLRDTPCLQNKISDGNSRDPDNTVFHKVFKGGHVTMAGANSSASLGNRPIRIALQDEIDRYPASVGTEGDPCGLATKRTTAFWNRKIGKFSTGTIKGRSRIESAYEASDMRKFYVPCPHCGEFQILKWKQLKWPKDEKGKHIPEDAWYECGYCYREITDVDKPQMLREGEWRAERQTKGIAGFWLNELYSPWVSFGNMAVRFIQAKKGGPEVLQVFINTALAETWEEGETTVDDNTLVGRREQYGPEVPAGAVLLTAGVDIQVDRIEVRVDAHAVGNECWGLEHKILYGDPVRKQVWDDLDEYLMRLWKHEFGIYLPVSGVAIDTGYLNHQVYAFVKPRQTRRVHGYLQRVFAIKGANEPMKPFLNRPSKNNIAKINLFNIGVNTAKDTLHARLRITEPGPGYVHHNYSFDEEYFKQLTNEVRKIKKGVRIWEAKAGAKVEGLDLAVYSMAALGLLNINLEKLAVLLQEKIKKQKEQGDQEGGNPIVPVPKKTGRRVISQGIKRDV